MSNKKKSSLGFSKKVEKKKDFELEFLSQEESALCIESQLKELAQSLTGKSRYYFIRLKTRKLTAIGIAISFLVGKEIHVKCA